MNKSDPKRSIFIASLGDHDHSTLLGTRALLDRYPLVTYQIAPTLDEAQIVLYVEHGYIGLTDLPRLLARIRAAPSAMHFLFSESDWPFPVLPGAFPSLSKQVQWARSWSYLPSWNVQPDVNDGEPDFLFSFLGRISTHPVRKFVRRLDAIDTPCLDVEEAPRRLSSYHYSKSYFQLIRRSQFVLCPRGFGSSSIRIFEAMSCGRVPVIISDQWMPPPEISWKDFSVVVPQKDVLLIPKILNDIRARAQEMGQLAQQVFVQYFAPNVFIERLLTTLVANYSNCSFTPAATLNRAWKAMSFREIRTLGHQSLSLTHSHLSRLARR